MLKIFQLIFFKTSLKKIKFINLELEIESILLFGACQKFSISGVNSDINSRVVVSDGTFFFPYAGNVDAGGYASQIRET